MVLCFISPGEHVCSAGSGARFIASQKTGQRLKVSSDRLEGPGIELGTPGYKTYLQPHDGSLKSCKISFLAFKLSDVVFAMLKMLKCQ